MGSALFGLFVVMVIVGLCIFALLVLPVWAIIDCAMSPQKTGKTKSIWIVALVLTWTLGALVYSLSASKQKVLRIAGIVTTILAVLIAAFGLYTFSKIRSAVIAEVNQLSENLKNVDTKGLTPQQVDVIYADLKTLSSEQHFSSISPTSYTLIVYQYNVQDNKIDAKEYAEWHDIFTRRKSLTEGELKQIRAKMDEIKDRKRNGT